MLQANAVVHDADGRTVRKAGQQVVAHAGSFGGRGA